MVSGAAGRVRIHNRIIPAVGKHIVTHNAVTSGGKGIGVDKSAYGGVIVSALQVIEIRFLVIDVTPVAQGVIGAQSAGHGAGNTQPPFPRIPRLKDICNYIIVAYGNFVQ